MSMLFTPSAIRMAILREIILPGSKLTWLNAGETSGEVIRNGTVGPCGGCTPMFSATRVASTRSMFARISFTSRSRMYIRSTLPSSKLYAAMMCSCSCRLMLFQNRRAWEKKITKGFAAITDFVTRHCLSIGIEPAPHRRFRCFLGPASVNGIGFVTGTPLVDRLAMKGITLVVVEGTYRTVDRNFIKIRSAQTQ